MNVLNGKFTYIMIKTYRGRQTAKIIPELLKHKLYVSGWSAKPVFDYIVDRYSGNMIYEHTFAQEIIFTNSKLYLSVYFDNSFPVAWCLVIKTGNEFIIYRFTKKKFRKQGIAFRLCKHWLDKFSIPTSVIKNDLGQELVFYQ